MLKAIARSLWFVAFLFAAASTAQAQAGNLNIYWIDVEGGAATLIVVAVRRIAADRRRLGDRRP